MTGEKDKKYGLPSIAIILGYIAVKDKEIKEEKIRVLDQLGFGNQEMAIICNTNEPSIRAIRSKIRREKNSNK